jgi:arabinan endo-1,5-alpha-L-arabinosidase
MIAVVLSACGSAEGEAPDAGPAGDDGAGADASVPSDGARGGDASFDAGGSDAGRSDAGGSDAGGGDASGSDAGGSDASGSDAGGSDAGGHDAGAHDAAVGTDAGGGPDGAGGSDAASGADARSDAGSDASPACGGSALGGGPLTTTTTHLDIGVHDPSMIWDGSRYRLFATGGTLNVRSSPDILTWSNSGNVFPAIPGWVSTAVGSTVTDLWAPDISYFNGKFHVYYAGSTFGSNSSVIGLATTASLQTPAWTDEGLVVQSTASDDFNAIDPNVSFDASCTPWLAFGSFWSGIKLRQLDPTTGKPSTANTTTYSLASRNGGAIEAASIISHNGYYYLFVSFDLCCKGVSSTYRTMVGRATSITGPYVDKTGTDMMNGGAEQLLATSGRYIGPGGGTAWKDGSNYLYVYHYYDGDDGGVSKLQVRPITFDTSDWIVLGNPLFP